MLHVLASLSHLLSFDHAQCDAILQARHIEVINAYAPNKGPGWRDSVYVGLWVILGWETLVVAFAVNAWRSSKQSATAVQKFGLPIFALIGAFLIGVQLKAMADYVDACRGLLNLH